MERREGPLRSAIRSIVHEPEWYTVVDDPGYREYCRQLNTITVYGLTLMVLMVVGTLTIGLWITLGVPLAMLSGIRVDLTDTSPDHDRRALLAALSDPWE